MKILIQEQDPTCLCLQETRHNNRILYPPSGYKIIQSSSSRADDRDRGVAILISKTTNYRPLTLNVPENIEAVAIQVYSERFYTVCSIYLSPSLSITKENMVDLIEQANELLIVFHSLPW